MANSPVFEAHKRREAELAHNKVITRRAMYRILGVAIAKYNKVTRKNHTITDFNNAQLQAMLLTEGVEALVETGINNREIMRTNLLSVIESNRMKGIKNPSRIFSFETEEVTT